jgi:UDP-N-acetylglucosamine:LPS N-acetylglucosamine transferase
VDRSRKKVLVLISRGGGGHISVGHSVKEILGDLYDVEIINVFDETLYPLDFLHRLTRGAFSGEDLYNFFLRWGLTFLHLYACLGNWYMFRKRGRIEDLFAKYLTEKGGELPDLIISTVPFINSGLVTAAQERELPFLILPADLDASTYLNGFLHLDLSDYKQFKFVVPYDDPDIHLKVEQHSHLKPDQLEIPGFPVRRASQKKYTEEEIGQLRGKHGMHPNHQTITVVAGALGSDVIFEHAKKIAELDPHECGGLLEVNICVGQNRKIGQRIMDHFLLEGSSVLRRDPAFTTMRTNGGLIVHIRDFTEELIEIMAASHLIITKTGGSSVCEALYLGKTMLLDNTKHSSARYLWWEHFNIGFVEKYQLGISFKNPDELTALIPKYLKNPPRPTIPFSPPDFEKNLVDLVSRMI